MPLPAASVPVLTFVSCRSESVCECQNQRDTSEFDIFGFEIRNEDSRPYAANVKSTARGNQATAACLT